MTPDQSYYGAATSPIDAPTQILSGMLPKVDPDTMVLQWPLGVHDADTLVLPVINTGAVENGDPNEAEVYRDRVTPTMMGALAIAVIAKSSPEELAAMTAHQRPAVFVGGLAVAVFSAVTALRDSRYAGRHRR